MFAFSSTCPSWNAAGRRVKAKWTPKVPFLMLPENRQDLPSGRWTVVDLGMNKRYSVDLPETFGRRCWGCDDGWICTLGIDLEFNLFNPLTRVHHRLPSAHSFPLGDGVVAGSLNHSRRKWFQSRCIKNVTVCKIPANDTLLVCVRYYVMSFLAFAKPGDSEWFVIEDPAKGTKVAPYVNEVASFKGQFLILYEDGKLHSLGGLDNIIGNQTLFPEVYVNGGQDGYVSLWREGCIENMYLVKSNVDLLVALTYKGDLHRFRVFKFDSEEKDWLQVEDVGDVSLFVGKNSLVAGFTSNVAQCKPRSIYYIKDDIAPVEINGYELVLFDLENHQSGEIDTGGDTLPKAEIGSPFWFMPKLV